MKKPPYRRDFWNSLVCFSLFLLICAALLVYAISFLTTWRGELRNMPQTEATVVEIGLNVGRYGSRQDVTVTYTVDGQTYRRLLATDSKFSFAAGAYASYEVGETLLIHYDPTDPSVIAAPRSATVAILVLVFAALGFAFFLFWLVAALLRRERLRMTEEEYQRIGRAREAEKQKRAKKKRPRK